jgi:ATP-dependent protease ClpP protease subunit
MGTFSIWHWLIVLVVMVLPSLPALWVIKRSGNSRWQIIFAIIPLINFIWLWVFAFGKWQSPVNIENNLNIQSMDNESTLRADPTNAVKFDIQDTTHVDNQFSNSVKSQKSTNSTYIGRHWRGENSLAWAYWINGALLNVSTYAFVTILHENTTILDEIIPWLTNAVAMFSITIWSSVGIWRTATKSINQAHLVVPKKPCFWAYVAKFMVIIGALQIIAAWEPLVKDMLNLYALESSDMNTQYFIQYQGDTDIILNGYINEVSVGAIKKAFEEDQNRTALVMNSPGGILISAYELADFVEQNKIIVAADGDCFSACLLVLASAELSLVSPNTKLFFHHPEAITDFVSEGMTAVLSEEIIEYYDRFKRYGVPEEKIKEYRLAKEKILTIGEAYNSYIVDKIWYPVNNKIYEIEKTCEQVDCYVYPMNITDVVDVTE